MNIETARGVAARVWCDEEMGSVVMDADLAEAIAWIVLAAAALLKAEETGDDG